MDRVHNRTTNKLGRPNELSEVEEDLLAERIKLMGDWGYPLNMVDVRKLVQDYLNSSGKSSRWRDNYPGEDWARGFVKRRSDLSNRMSNLIKRSRAQLSREMVRDFYENYEKVAEDIPASNVFNYDETNLTDDPGAKKALFRRGVKYAEKVCDHSKSAISVMFCGSADGKLLPPYVVYKAGNLYDSWCKGGPKGTRYNVTKSGWFDMPVFEDWFENSFLPEVRRLEGKKVLTGDNLASHISTNVIELCKQHNIEFVCLPPNSTHILQPLDVGLYGPMKAHWRSILRDLKERDPSAKPVNKVVFPGMLKQLVEKVDSQQLLPKAFEKCGMFPINCERPSQRIPDRSSSVQVAANLDGSLLEMLEVRRFGSQEARGRGRGGRGRGGGRGRKIPAGRSYTAQYSDSDSESDHDSLDGNNEELDLPDPERDIVAELNCVARGEGSVGARGEGSGGATGQSSGRGRGLGSKKRKRKSGEWTIRSFDRSINRRLTGQRGDDSEEDNSDTESDTIEDDDDFQNRVKELPPAVRKSKGVTHKVRPQFSDYSEDDDEGGEGGAESDAVGDLPDEDNNDPDYQVGSHVVAKYDNDWYIAQVEGEDPDEEEDGFTLLMYMERKGNNQFIWGKKDLFRTDNKDIICAVDPPVPVSSRAYGLNKEDLSKVRIKMQ